MRRLSLCRGDGAFVQAGATKTGNQSAVGSFGLGGLGDIIIGSKYSLGILFEILLNLRESGLNDEDMGQTGVVQRMPVTDTNVQAELNRIGMYLKATSEADWVDSVTLEWS